MPENYRKSHYNELKNRVNHAVGAVFVLLLIMVFCINILIYGYEKKTVLTDIQATMRMNAYSLTGLTNVAESYLNRLNSAYINSDFTSPIVETFAINEGINKNAPFESKSGEFKAYYGSIYVHSGVSLTPFEASVMTLSPIMKAQHNTDKRFQWSYYYDGRERFSTLYPQLSVTDILQSTNCGTVDSAIYAVFSAGGTNPVPLVGPIANPERKMIWTKPYKDAAGSGMVVSVLNPVYKNETFIGAFGTDVNLTMLDSALLAMKDPRLQLSIITAEKMVVSTNDPAEKVAESSHCSPKSLTTTFSYDKNRFEAALPLGNTEWFLVGSFSNEIILKSIKMKMMIFTLASLILVTVLILLFVLLNKQLVSPSIQLVATIEELSTVGESTPKISVPLFWKEWFARIEIAFEERHDFLNSLTERTAQLSQQKSILNAQYNASKEGILVVSPEGLMISWNRNFRDMWHIPSEIMETGHDEEAINHVQNLLEEPHLFVAVVKNLYANPSITQEDTIKLKDGRVFDRYTTPIRGERGEFFGRVWFFHDITEIKKTEQMVAAKNHELEQIIYVTSHDLRSPLVNVDGYSRELQYQFEALQEIFDKKDCEKTAEFIEKELADMQGALKFIRNSTQQMDKVLKGLLKLSRSGRESITLTSLTMKELVTRVASTFEYQLKEFGGAIEIGDIPNCYGDEPQVMQVFSNLIGNSIKFRETSRSLQIQIKGYTENGRSIFSIEDNGVGIAPEHKDKVFELFHRLNPSSTDGEGLGLTIVRQTLWRLEGTIEVESVLGQWTRFTISLPENVMKLIRY